jgi:hypothetical protein
MGQRHRVEGIVPQLTIPEDTFRRLAAKAAALNISVEDLVAPVLDQVASQDTSPLTGEDWQREREAWKRDAESRADRYPPGHVLDDSRETIYGEREREQL